MLYLLVRLGGDDYAIEAAGIRRVVPLARLKALPSRLAEIAGVLNYHGAAVPVLDLTRIVTGRPSPERLGTRIVLATVPLPGSDPRLLGLAVEDARSVVRFEAEAFQAAGVKPDGTEWLGPVAEHGSRLVQRIEILRLLPPAVLAALTADAAAALAA